MSQKLAKVFGVIFVIVAIIGFIPNPIVGDGAIFHTNIVHNLVHLIVGIILFIMAKKEQQATLWLKIFGAVYIVVALLGFLSVHGGMGSILGIIAVNGADNWLHVVLGLILLGAGFMGKKGMPAMASMPSSSGPTTPSSNMM